MQKRNEWKQRWKRKHKEKKNKDSTDGVSICFICKRKQDAWNSSSAGWQAGRALPGTRNLAAASRRRVENRYPRSRILISHWSKIEETDMKGRGRPQTNIFAFGSDPGICFRPGFCRQQVICITISGLWFDFQLMPGCVKVIWLPFTIYQLPGYPSILPYPPFLEANNSVISSLSWRLSGSPNGW